MTEYKFLLMTKSDIENYVHSRLPKGIHITLNLPKDLYTQEEADKYLNDALQALETIKKLRK